MTAVTHSAISIFCNLVVLSFFNFTITAYHIIAMIIFSLLPDIDSPNSLAGRTLFFVSDKINLAFGHRGFIHSLTFLTIIIITTSVLFFTTPPHIYIFALILYIAYFSHLIADCFNLSGVRLFYPSPAVYVFPTDEGFRSRSGNMRIEIPLTAIFITISIIYYIAVIGNNGFISFLRLKFADPGMAKEQYISFEKSKYYADITIYDKIKRENIKFKHVEIYYNDENKVIFPTENKINFYENGDFFQIKKIALSRSEQQFNKKNTTATLDIVLLEDFKCATGKVYIKTIETKNQFITKENDTLKIFFADKKQLTDLNTEIQTKNEELRNKINEESYRLSSMTTLLTRKNIESLENEKRILLRILNSSNDIKTKLDISDRINKLDNKIDTLTINLSLIDSSNDETIKRKIEELKSQITENIQTELTLIR